MEELRLGPQNASLRALSERTVMKPGSRLSTIRFPLGMGQQFSRAS